MPLPLAVADTSVLINFHFLGRLNSLSLFYRQVLVPSEVRREFLEKTEYRSSRQTALVTLERQELFLPCEGSDSIQKNLLMLDNIDPGEAEALSQLEIRSADVLLIDEKRGRKVAQKEMRQYEGTAMILARLHILRYLDIWSSVEKLREMSGFWIAKEIVPLALDRAMKEHYFERWLLPPSDF